MKMGDHVVIESDTVSEASSIGSYIHIGKDCVIGRFVVIKDCVKILDGSVVPANTIIPPFSVYGGNPAKLVDEWTEAAQEIMQEDTVQYYYSGFLCRAST
ncbi:hypothetical protein BSLG_003974 [Batrachochytrium salamandrivorans]|nr:hypothetical protein BSLG_003974 [Batrachochytrium salamandrivorans]